MPMPVSRTRTARRRGSPGASSTFRRTCPRSVNLSALLTEPLRLRALAEQRHDGVDDLGRVDGDALELELARLDLGEIQDVVDDRKQALARAGDDLGVAPLPHRQIRRRQELGHDQHAVHRRADLVAHGGEELGLRDVGGFRRLLGLAQVVGAIGDLLLERLAVLLEAAIALADLADHAVEARGQDADLVVALDLDGGAVVVALADGRHGAGERHERRRDRALQPERDHEPDRHRQRGTGDRGEQQVAEAAEQVVRVADDDEAADGLAGIDDRDGDRTVRLDSRRQSETSWPASRLRSPSRRTAEPRSATGAPVRSSTIANTTPGTLPTARIAWRTAFTSPAASARELAAPNTCAAASSASRFEAV